MFNPEEHLTKLDRGGTYLEVKWRLVWFRDVNKTGKIQTELICRTDNEAVFKATVIDDNGAVATAYGTETKADFKDYTEKAETKAVGRALGYLGYGTQFAPELDEGNIADSPVDMAEQAAQEFGGISAPSSKDERLISDRQRARLFALSNGQEAIVRQIIAQYGYESSKDIRRWQYDEICDKVERLARGQ